MQKRNAWILRRFCFSGVWNNTRRVRRRRRRRRRRRYLLIRYSSPTVERASSTASPSIGASNWVCRLCSTPSRSLWPRKSLSTAPGWCYFRLGSYTYWTPQPWFSHSFWKIKITFSTLLTLRKTMLRTLVRDAVGNQFDFKHVFMLLINVQRRCGG